MNSRTVFESFMMNSGLILEELSNSSAILAESGHSCGFWCHSGGFWCYSSGITRFRMESVGHCKVLLLQPNLIWPLMSLTSRVHSLMVDMLALGLRHWCWMRIASQVRIPMFNVLTLGSTCWHWVRVQTYWCCGQGGGFQDVGVVLRHSLVSRC